MDAGAIERELDDLETRIERLRALYEQYFMGIEKLEPQIPRKEVERRIQLLRREQIRNTALRFKFQMLVQRYNTMQQYWARVTREIENGTYRRDVMRAAARFGAKEATTILGKRRAQKYAALAEAQAAQKARRVGGEVDEAEEIDVEPDDDEAEFIADDLVEEAAPSVAVPIPMGEAFGDPLPFLPPAAKEVEPPPAPAPTPAATPTPAGLGGLRWGPPRPAERSATATPAGAPAVDPRGAIRPVPAPVAKGAAGLGAKGAAEPVAKAAAAPVAKTAAELAAKTAAAEPVATGAVKGAVAAGTKGVAEPVAKTTAAPVAKSAVEPVAKGVAAPVVKGAAEPGLKGATAPAAKGAVAPVAKGPAETIAKTAAEAGVKSAVAPAAKAPAETVPKTSAEPGVKSRVAALAAAARTPAGQRSPTAGGDTAKGTGALDLDFDEGPMRAARKAAAAPSALDLDDLDLGGIGAPNKK